MLSSFRNRFGIPGMISVVALVFAMFGGAYAASDNGNSGSAATASAKAKKGPPGPKGPKGAKGATGATGPAGPAGPKGDKGSDGAAGSNGSNGSDGADGTSVTTSSFAGAKAPCAKGGVEVKSASPTVLVCNGQDGEDGETGFTETLPSEKTETGAWALPTGVPKETTAGTVLSFPIPLPPGTEPSFEFVAKDGPSTANCPGTALEPDAAPNYLCVYAGSEFGSSFTAVLPSNPGAFLTPGVGLTGAVVDFAAGENPVLLAIGTWAVTAP